MVSEICRAGSWLPEDHRSTQEWLQNLIKDVDGAKKKELKHEIRQFKEHVESDRTLEILASLMFEEVPTKEPYNRDPLSKPQVRDFDHLLELLDRTLDHAPKWGQFGGRVGLIGFPINAMIDWPICTASGNAFFLRPDVNERWRCVLNRWTVYLKTPQSANVLTNNAEGWFGTSALKRLEEEGNSGATDYTFDQLYLCDKTREHFGFKSWDDFFTREFRPHIRRLTTSIPTTVLDHQNIDNPEPLIYNACESKPVFLRRHLEVGEKAKFWMKGQPYSLHDMLAGDPLTPLFIHGTVYQAYLSALSYHRWHSPVNGTVRRAFNVPGTYFSANYFEGFANASSKGAPDDVAPNSSQAYIAQVAARAVIFIQADDEDIGLMCFVAIGICEVSSNEITVAEGQHVDAGEQIGTFHYGGSTHCLLFRKEVEVVFYQEPTMGSIYKPLPKYNTPVRTAIACVRKPTKHWFWNR